MRSFSVPNRKQKLLLTEIDLESIAPVGSALRYIDELVEMLDTSAIEVTYDLESEQGRNPIHPKTFIKVGLYALHNCRFSLRKMQEDIENHLGYKWLTSGRGGYIRPTYIAVLLIVTVVVLINYPSFLYVGTFNQYHNLAGETREAMEKAWSNPYGFSVAWVMVMMYFTIAFFYLIWTIRKEVARSPTV